MGYTFPFHDSSCSHKCVQNIVLLFPLFTYSLPNSHHVFGHLANHQRPSLLHVFRFLPALEVLVLVPA